MNKKVLITAALVAVLFSCKEKKQSQPAVSNNQQGVPAATHKSSTETVDQQPNTASQIYHKPEIPVLCYHRIADGVKSDYAVSPATFRAHMQILADSGYHAILPDALYDYLVFNKSLPEKPFLVSFDDSRAEHSAIAAPVLEKLGFRGVFFIMTITYDKKNYMTKDQIAALAKAGHCVGLHSWDHTMATKYKEPADWKKQVEDPQQKLATITGQPVSYWAYPNGVFNHESAKQMARYFKLAFELSTRRDSLQPLQSVRRIIVPDMSAQALLKSMRRNFGHSQHN